MRQILAILVLSLTACLISSCTPASPVLVRPALEIPDRPAMLPVAWQHDEDIHCLDDGQARNLLINTSRLQAHIEVLEGYLQAVNQEK